MLSRVLFKRRFRKPWGDSSFMCACTEYKKIMAMLPKQALWIRKRFLSWIWITPSFAFQRRFHNHVEFILLNDKWLISNNIKNSSQWYVLTYISFSFSRNYCRAQLHPKSWSLRVLKTKKKNGNGYSRQHCLGRNPTVHPYLFCPLPLLKLCNSEILYYSRLIACYQVAYIKHLC